MLDEAEQYAADQNIYEITACDIDPAVLGRIRIPSLTYPGMS